MRKESYEKISCNDKEYEKQPKLYSKEHLLLLREKCFRPEAGPAWANLYFLALAERKERQTFIEYIFDLDPK